MVIPLSDASRGFILYPFLAANNSLDGGGAMTELWDLVTRQICIESSSFHKSNVYQNL